MKFISLPIPEKDSNGVSHRKEEKNLSLRKEESNEIKDGIIAEQSMKMLILQIKPHKRALKRRK